MNYGWTLKNKNLLKRKTIYSNYSESGNGICFLRCGGFWTAVKAVFFSWEGFSGKIFKGSFIHNDRLFQKCLDNSVNLSERDGI